MRVLLFGLIAEKANTSVIEVEASSTFALKRSLASRIEGLESMSFALAVDRRIVNEDLPLTGSEEIALLPPFAGG